METGQHHDYLRAALTSLARQGERSRQWGDGHWGAAVAAGCFFVEESVADAECAREIERQMALFIATYADRFAPAIEQSSPPDDAVGPLLAALDGNIDRLCWVGHNVIYAALSLNALRRVPDLAGAVPGIARLTALFDRSIPGRSWIDWTIPQVRDTRVDETALPLSTPADVSRTVLEELSAFRTIFQAESHHDLIGHLLDFAQAVNLLHDLGHEGLFVRALSPLRRFILVLRSSQDLTPGQPMEITSPVDRPPLREAPAASTDPLTAAYWRRDLASCGWSGGHAFKFPYAYYDHARRVESDLRFQSRRNFMKILGGSCGVATAA
jgi:hypothetical protein